MDGSKVVIIVSGGMDSTTLLYDIVNKVGQENVHALSFFYGSKHNAEELPKAQATCEKLGVKHKLIDVSEVFANYSSNLLNGGAEIPTGHYAQDNMKQTIVPFRNGILLAMAVGYAETIGAKEVLYGSHQGDHFIYEDCRPEFVDAFSSAARLGTMGKITVKAPYSLIDKSGILGRGIELGVDYSLTHTCYSPTEDGMSCGKCGACCERLEAFAVNNAVDPLVYVDREFYKTVTGK